MPDAEIKRLMRDLEEAINQTLSASATIHHAIQAIHEAGYEAFLILDATLGFTPKGAVATETITDPVKVEEPVRLRITSEDAKFLKSLKISSEVEG